MCVAMLMLVARAPVAAGQPGGPRAERGWSVHTMGPDHGLPTLVVTDLAFGNGGTILMSTYDGLVTSDGERISVSRRSDLVGLPSNRFRQVEIDPDDAVWLVEAEGLLVRLRGGRVESWGEGAGLRGRARAIWRDGERMLLGTAAGLYALGPSGPKPLHAGTLVAHIASIASRREGGLWIGTTQGEVLEIAKDDDTIPPRRRSVCGPTEEVRSIADTPAGVFVACHRLARLVGAGAEEVPVAAEVTATSCERVVAVAVDAQGQAIVRCVDGWWTVANGSLRPEVAMRGAPRVSDWWTAPVLVGGVLWRVAPGGLYRGHQRVAAFDGHAARALLVRGEDAWVAIEGVGLTMVSPATVDTIAAGSKGRLEPFGSVARLADGGLIAVGHDGGLVRVEEDGAHRDLAHAGFFLESVHVARDGAVLVAGADGVFRFEGGAFVREGLPPGPENSAHATAVHVGADGKLWVGLRHGLAVRPRGETGGGWRWYSRTDSGQPIRQPRQVAEAGDGTLFWTTNGSGLLRVRGDRVESLAASQGLPSDRLRALYLDPGTGLWVGTEDAGLCLVEPQAATFANSRVACIARNKGLVEDMVSTIVPASTDRLLLAGNLGVSLVRRDGLLSALRGETSELMPLLLDERHGMASRETNGQSSAPWTRDAANNVVLATMNGLVVIDADRLPTPVPPMPRVTRVMTGGLALNLSSETVEVPPDAHMSVEVSAVEHHFAASVRVQYRLDRDAWSTVRDSREITFARLPPEQHHLEFRAGIGGRWSAPRGLTFYRRPSVGETTWFRALAVLLLLAAAAVLVRLKLRGAARQRAAMQATISAQTSALRAANRELAERNAEVLAQAARLAEVDGLKSRFLQNISHELRAPLTMITGPLLEIRDSLPAEIAHDADVALANAERMDTLVGQLLDVARLEAGRLPLQARRRDLTTVVRAVTDRFSVTAAQASVALRLVVPNTPVVWWHDPDLVDKALTNLIVNAIQVAPPGSTVQVSLSVTDDDARLTVTDEGPGVRPEDNQRVFERFFQSDRTDVKHAGTLGLGLSIVADIANLHGGAVGVDSVPGEGASFWLTIPAGEAHLAVDEIACVDLPHEHLAGSGAEVGELRDDDVLEDNAAGDGRPRVLVVEDHADLRAFLAARLGRRYAVATACDGVEALETARQHRPGLVVTDLVMPRLDGVGLCHAIRADPDLAGVKILIASAKADAPTRVQGLEIADDFIAKPFAMRELLLRCGALLARPSPNPPATAPSEASEEVPTADSALEHHALTVSGADRDWLDRLEAAIDRDLCASDWSVDKLARTMAQSPRHFRRTVRRLTGATPVELVRELRLRRARALLTEGRFQTVAEVAAAVGMSPRYLRRAYQEWTGESPSGTLLRTTNHDDQRG